jgi:diguanylate cyclase (GGDEF)-like protein
LNRWEINPSDLPSGSKILFKRPEFYKEHFIELAAASALIILILISIRYRELKQYNRKINSARQGLESANTELGRVKQSLEEKNEMLRELSITDSLTGLYNRAFLDEKLRDEFNRIERNRDYLSIILADIDYFKQVNDQYGHQVGDEVLVSIANLFRQNVRTVDSIGRWGGEEFIIICPGSDEHQAFQLAEKLREIIHQARHTQVDSVTCSFGVATHEPGITRSQLILLADNALYESKKSGRNRVTVANELSVDDMD